MRKTDSEILRKTLQVVERADPKLGCSYVYLITCGRYTKIGIACEPTKRLALMQIGNPHELRLAKVWYSECAQVDEECLHAEFEAFRVRGEWFLVPGDKLRELCRLTSLARYRE